MRPPATGCTATSSTSPCPQQTRRPLKRPRPAVPRTRCAATMPASVTRQRPGTNRAVSLPRSSGIGGTLSPGRFIVTNMSRPAENGVVFYNRRGTCEIVQAELRMEVGAAVSGLMTRAAKTASVHNSRSYAGPVPCGS
jgi:hypothetical protein